VADRTLCDSTKTSQRLGLLTRTSFGLYPYIFQETDDYGRLDTNPALIKAQRFPLVKWVTKEMIEKAIQEYNRPEVAILFLWEFDNHRFGYFVNFEARSGKYLSKRRKSPIPEPPPEILSKWLRDNNRFQTLPTVQNSSYKLSQVKLSQVKLSQVKLNKDADQKSAKISLSPEEQRQKIVELEKKVGTHVNKQDSVEQKEIEKVRTAFCQKFPKGRFNWGVIVKIVRGDDYQPTPPDKLVELIAQMRDDLDDPLARLIDMVKKLPAYVP